MLQWIVAQTTSARGEVYRVLRANRNSCGHRVNSGGQDLDIAQSLARCRMRQARRVTRLPASHHSRCERNPWQVFSSRVAFTLSTLHNAGRPPNSPKRGTFEGYDDAPGAAISCRRRAILLSTDRPDYSPASEWPYTPVPCDAAAIMARTNHHVSPVRHPISRIHARGI